MMTPPTARTRRPTPRVVRHADTWLPLERLGQASLPYLPTYEDASPSIDEFHRYLATCPTNGILIDLGLEGWLQRADALKLYELGYFAHGDILEFGTFSGLSTLLLARAIEASGRRARVVTMEIDPAATRIAELNLAARSMSSFVEFRVGRADPICRDLIADGSRFSFAFVDHSHAYEPMVQACESLSNLLSPGAFCLFHDLNDRRNGSYTGVGAVQEDFGVYAAVQAALDAEQFEFYGIFGCCGLYRKIS